MLTGRQVIVAPGRSQRPGARIADPPLSDPSDGNPFLEGNEHNTPGERLALRRCESSANSPGWLVRVVPNQFPAVGMENPRLAETNDDLTTSSAISGFHDVVIESPDSHRRLAELSAAQTARIILAWQRRVLALEQQTAIQSITVFRNEGFSAGASLPHVHSQILAMDSIPPQTADRLRTIANFRQETGNNLLYELCNEELVQEHRIVNADDHCLVMCPFAGRVSWQVRIIPRQTAFNSFSRCPESALVEVAASLHAAARAVDECAGPMPMNVLLILPPSTNCTDGWFLELMPRSAGIAGYELATDIDIVTVAPETAAHALRGAFCKTVPPRNEIIPPGYDWRNSSVS